jgi:hypothetical protein
MRGSGVPVFLGLFVVTFPRTHPIKPRLRRYRQMAEVLSNEERADLRQQLVALDQQARAIENELRSSLPADKFQRVQELTRLVQTIQAKLMQLLE